MIGLKKKCQLNNQIKRSFIDKQHPTLSITRQAELLGISRAGVYYTPTIPIEDISIMHAIDQIYTQLPFYGSRRMRDELKDEYGINCCRERVQRLMRQMGIEAIYPKKRISQPNIEHRIYPYLLRNMKVEWPNHVWSTDITYIKLKTGFCYLTVILDWFSRYVLSWELSKTMTADFCIRALQSALKQTKPKIHNSDQGSQYTSHDYLDVLQDNEILISMDGRGRYFDNIFVERLWRSIKYEDIYIKNYETIESVYNGLGKYFPFYNNKRRHQSLDRKTPSEVYYG